jgi:hypothetical protein
MKVQRFFVAEISPTPAPNPYQPPLTCEDMESKPVAKGKNKVARGGEPGHRLNRSPPHYELLQEGVRSCSALGDDRRAASHHCPALERPGNGDRNRGPARPGAGRRRRLRRDDHRGAGRVHRGGRRPDRHGGRLHRPEPALPQGALVDAAPGGRARPGPGPRRPGGERRFVPAAGPHRRRHRPADRRAARPPAGCARIVRSPPGTGSPSTTTRRRAGSPSGPRRSTPPPGCCKRPARAAG